MTSDRILTLIAIAWFVLALLYLAGAGIIHVGAAPACQTWTC